MKWFRHFLVQCENVTSNSVFFKAKQFILFHSEHCVIKQGGNLVMNWNVRPGIKLRSFHLSIFNFPSTSPFVVIVNSSGKPFPRPATSSCWLPVPPHSISLTLFNQLMPINLGFCSMLNNMPNAFYSPYWGALREAMSMEKSIFSWSLTLSADDPSRQNHINNRVDLTMAQIYLIIESQQQINQLFLLGNITKQRKSTNHKRTRGGNFFFSWNEIFPCCCFSLSFSLISFHFPPIAIRYRQQPSTIHPTTPTFRFSSL